MKDIKNAKPIQIVCLRGNGFLQLFQVRSKICSLEFKAYKTLRHRGTNGHNQQISNS